MFEYFLLPRLDEPTKLREFHADVRTRVLAPGTTPVLLAAFWPARQLADPWPEFLLSTVRDVEDQIGRNVVVAEVPVALFADLQKRFADAVQHAAGPTMVDQMFRPGVIYIDPGRITPLTRQLQLEAPSRILERLLQLNIIVSGHFKLPSGRHADTNVRLGDFPIADGGHGTASFMVSVVARQLHRVRPDAIAYWGEGSLDWFATELAERLSTPRKPVELIRLGGTYGQLLFATDPRGRHTPASRIAVIGDVAATGSLLERAAELMGDISGSPPVAVVPLLALTAFTPRLTALARDFERWRFLTTTAAGHVWIDRDCPLCKEGIPLVEVDHTSHRDPLTFRRDLHQPPRAQVLASALVGGQLGQRPDEEDGRHLHDAFLRPGLTREHMDALLDDHFLRAVASHPFDAIAFHSNRTCRAIVERIRRYFPANYPEYPLTRRLDRWRLPRDFKRGERVLFVDDGANTGRALFQILHEIRRCGAVPAAVVVFEDKLPDWAHATLRSVAKDRRDDVGLFFVHRSPHTRDGVVEDMCTTCETREFAYTLLGSTNPGTVSYVRRAYDRILRAEVLPRMKDDEVSAFPLDVTRADEAPEQLSQLLGLPQFEGGENLRLMNVVVQDFLPDLRRRDQLAAGIHEALRRSDARWVERALLWMDLRELAELEEFWRGRTDWELSACLNRLRRTDRPDGLASTLNMLCRTVNAAAKGDELERRYYDLVEHVLLGLVNSSDREAWLRAILKELDSVRPLRGELRQLRIGLRHLSAEHAVQRGSVLAFRTNRDGHTREPGAEQVRNWSRVARWTIDARTRTARFRDGRANSEIPEAVAALLATAVVGGRLTTTRATRILKRASLGKDARDRRMMFNRLCADAQHGDYGSAFVAELEERDDTARKGREWHLSWTGVHGLIVWRDNARPPWNEITRLTTRR